jgi:tight adherence protein B
MWVLIFLLLTAALGLLMSLMEPQTETVDQRLNRLVRQRKELSGFVTRDLPGTPLEPAAPAVKRSAKEAVVGALEQATSTWRFSTNIAGRLHRAGWRWRPAEFLIAQVVAAGFGLALSGLLKPALWWLFAVGGWIMPFVMLSRAEKARIKRFEQQLPDGLAIISNALRSGYSFLQAMDVVSREMPEPISLEFGLVLRETRVNIPIDEALSNLVERIKSPDLDLVVTAVLIQRQVGGNLSEVLEKIGETVKERIRLQGEVRTLTTQGRISGWIVSLLPLVLAGGMSVIAPGYLNPLMDHPIGWALLFVGVIMQGIGILTIKNMVNVEV